MKTIVSIKDLTKNYSSVVAIDNVNLEIFEGEIFGLLGPNGSGKTTLLKILLGLLFPTQGKVQILEREPTDIGIKNEIGFLPEIPQFYPYLNPIETLDFYACLFNLPSKVREERIKELLELVGLFEHRKKRLKTFSKGMLQRIGLAASLINDPKLLLLDEPTIGLDPIGSLQVRDLLLGLKAKGKTILLCSHLLSEVEYACDNIAILYRGRLIKHGRLLELLAKQDEIQINIKSREEKDKEKLLQFINKENMGEMRVAHCRQSLEEFFCKTIQQSKDVV